MPLKKTIHFGHLFALILFAITVSFVWAYPYAKFFLLISLFVYAVFSIIKPPAWLIVLPAVLPILSLAPWSGRFYLEEFDFFIWVTLATALWRGDFVWRNGLRFTGAAKCLIGLLLLAQGIALIRGLLPFPEIDINAFNNYYSHYNALRVEKALIWAVLLILPLQKTFFTYQALAKEYLCLGVCLGLLGTGLAIFWERGVFQDLLYGNGLWGRIQSLTNFSSEYRATGLFADMHTGGEAIDGYLAMAWPFALGLLLNHSNRYTLSIGLIALPIGLYAALVTFSRGTYLAVMVSLLAFGIGYMRKMAVMPADNKFSWWHCLLLLVALGACVMSYSKGGWYALFAALSVFSAALALTFWQNLRLQWRVLLMGSIFVIGSLLMMHGLLTSKWVTNSRAMSLVIVALINPILILTATLIGLRARQFLAIKGLATLLAVVVSLAAVCVPIASGSYINSRFNTANSDLVGRMAHWQHTLDIMDSDWSTMLFGMGAGTFPRTYGWNSVGNVKEHVSMAKLGLEPFNTYLKLSSTRDLTIGQRLNLQANKNYRLSINVRPQAKEGAIGLSVCRRNILQTMTWNPTCVYFEKAVTRDNGEWQTLVWSFNMGQNGDDGRIGKLPLILRVSNGLPQNEPMVMQNKPIDCDNIILLDEQGNNLLINGDFESNLDRWFVYTDIYHLPLHMKNLWITAYFDQGFLGLTALCGLGLYVFVSAARLVKQGNNFVLTLLASLLGFFAVGLIGTLLDVPRVSFMFYLLVFALLSQTSMLARLPRKPRITYDGYSDP